MVRQAGPARRRFEDTPAGFVAMVIGILAVFVLIVWGIPILAVSAGQL